MKQRWISGILCALLLASVLAPGAMAAEENLGEMPEEDILWTELQEAESAPAEEPELLSADEPAAEEDVPAGEPEPVEESEPVEEPEQAEDPGPEEVPAEPAETEADGPEEIPETDELPVSEEADLAVRREEDEAPIDDTVYVDGYPMDPEDPLFPYYTVGTDGDEGSYYYSDFVTRPLKKEVLRKGIDVSAWQGTINWTKVADWGVEFAILRCGYRTVSSGKLMEDGRFTDYIKGAKAAGIPVGVYIFSQAVTVKEAVEEADFMLKMVEKYDIDLPLVFDLEHYAGGRFSTAGLTAREITDMCKAFCARVEAAGYESMVYSNPSMLNHDLYPDELERLWLAHYTKQTDYSGHDYEYWQCTSDGIIDGIEGRVDMDFWFQPKGSKTGYSPTSPFEDVKKSDWYFDSVMKAYQAGVVKGVTDTAFQPKGTATRGQVVTMIHRMTGSPKASKTASFTDLTQSYYKTAVSWAAGKGVVNGVSDTQFCPDRAISRQELVTILYRMAGSPGAGTDLDEYTDAVGVADWAVDAMAWAVENKIITGYDDATLRPKGNASRAEVCAILMRYSALED